MSEERKIQMQYKGQYNTNIFLFLLNSGITNLILYGDGVGGGKEEKVWVNNTGAGK